MLFHPAMFLMRCLAILFRIFSAVLFVWIATNSICHLSNVSLDIFGQSKPNIHTLDFVRRFSSQLLSQCWKSIAADVSMRKLTPFILEIVDFLSSTIDTITDLAQVRLTFFPFFRQPCKIWLKRIIKVLTLCVKKQTRTSVYS